MTQTNNVWKTPFLQKFLVQMMILPAILFGIFIAYLIAKCVRARCPNRYTTESLLSQTFTFIILLVYGLYTGVATMTFRLFKCVEVQGTYYLYDDYSVVCFDDDYWWYGSIAIFGMIIYVSIFYFA